MTLFQGEIILLYRTFSWWNLTLQFELQEQDKLTATWLIDATVVVRTDRQLQTIVGWYLNWTETSLNLKDGRRDRFVSVLQTGFAWVLEPEWLAASVHRSFYVSTIQSVSWWIAHKVPRKQAEHEMEADVHSVDLVSWQLLLNLHRCYGYRLRYGKVGPPIPE